MNLCFKFNTPEEALEHLFQEAEKSRIKNGRAYVWQCHPSTRGNSVAGVSPIKREDLKDRIYTVEWWNDTVCIKFLDAVFMNIITGRSYPDKLSCCVVKFPTNS